MLIIAQPIKICMKFDIVQDKAINKEILKELYDIIIPDNINRQLKKPNINPFLTGEPLNTVLILFQIIDNTKPAINGQINIKNINGSDHALNIPEVSYSFHTVGNKNSMA